MDINGNEKIETMLEKLKNNGLSEQHVDIFNKIVNLITPDNVKLLSDEAKQQLKRMFFKIIRTTKKQLAFYLLLKYIDSDNKLIFDEIKRFYNSLHTLHYYYNDIYTAIDEKSADLLISLIEPTIDHIENIDADYIGLTKLVEIKGIYLDREIITFIDSILEHTIDTNNIDMFKILMEYLIEKYSKLISITAYDIVISRNRSEFIYYLISTGKLDSSYEISYLIAIMCPSEEIAKLLKQKYSHDELFIDFIDQINSDKFSFEYDKENGVHDTILDLNERYDLDRILTPYLEYTTYEYRKKFIDPVSDKFHKVNFDYISKDIDGDQDHQMDKSIEEYKFKVPPFIVNSVMEYSQYPNVAINKVLQLIRSYHTKYGKLDNNYYQLYSYNKNNYNKI